MSQRRVLIVASEPAHGQNVEKALTRQGAAFETVSPKSLRDVKGAYPLVCVVVPNSQVAGVLDKVAEFNRSDARTILVTESASLNDLVTLMRRPGVDHTILGFDRTEVVDKTIEKLFTGNIFGIEHYLPADTEILYERIHNFQERTEAIDNVINHAEQHGVRKRVRSAIAQVCEELLMNALYDAPVNEHGDQIFADVPPNERSSMPSPKPVSIRCAAENGRFSVAVRDRYGQLGKRTVLSYIEKCLKAAVQIDRKMYGAGLGIYLVANNASQYVVNVAYGVATEVICTFETKQKSHLNLCSFFIHPKGASNLDLGPVATYDRLPSSLDDE